ncbi:Flp family type IVb pilin [Halomonas sp. ZH2S]|uniref:Flp family type IVb pilin n=1 Tax=Vreelandella zhuhanensis TaxID=2684210 RepID=A0A7X3KP07_9GAMM|nr:Flp family type IVb pilin [Halomonas zhuhanensis]MWJ26999.1 Flp family type IVb pilin [Halomonas zhuhanensis]
MNKLMQGIERFWKDEEGAETVEWVLVCALIIAGFLAAYTPLSGAIGTLFDDIVTHLTGAATPPG